MEKHLGEDKLPFKPEPYWREGLDLPRFDPLNGNLNVDVAIVGGGITGITAAYLLVKEGLKVALLEASHLLNGTTGHTTAKITAQHGLIYDEFINHFGKSKARLYYEANMEALQFIKETIEQNKINCDFSQEDAYLYSTSETYAIKIEKEHDAYKALKIDGELMYDIPFELNVHNALVMKDQAQFHPLKYLSHLLKEAKKAGAHIFEETTAVNVEQDSQGTHVLTRNGLRVTCRRVLACSHFPFYEGTGLYFSRMHADRSYILGVKAKKDYPGGMYYNVDPPNRSLRSVKMNGETLILIGGESHKTGQGKDTLEHYKALETFGEDVLGTQEVLYRWSAQDLTTLDKLPYIGELSSLQPHVLVATGFRKWGMTNGTAAALLLADLVLDRKNRFKDLYSPSRFIADPSLKKFFMDNADVAKHLIKGKFDHPNTEIDELANDEGAVVTINGKRKGAYKDTEGKVYVVDTTCTHMGCEVNWNHGDRTWDCPCHGSRFSFTGEVVEGPAEKPLQRDEDFTMLDNLTSEDSGY
jgi:glycine/D-amino acid oxidase-like deaminating enzyme/nitrite reductase/ring-hydroxylating ferredoxin subunit